MQSINKHIYLLLVIIALVCFTAVKMNHKEVVETVSNEVETMQAYLLYNQELVIVPTTTSAKKTEAKVEELVSYMKQGAADFEQLLNEATQLNEVKINDKVMKISFDTLDYHPDNELRVLEALIYSCTQFDDVDSIQLILNEQVLTHMPIKQTPITNTSNTFGINHLQSNQMYLHEGEQITLYYEIKNNNKTYQVAQSLPIKDKEDYNEVMKTMFKSVNVSSFLVQPLAKYKITMDQECELKKDVLHLYLNKNVLDKDKQIKTKILKYLKLNLTQFTDIKYISIHVNGKVISENGKNKIPVR